MASSLDQGAYNQTNTAQDPDYWSRQLTNPNPRIRAQAELALKQLYEERDFGQREQDRGETRAQRFQISDLNRGAREDSHAETLAAMTADRESKRESLQFANDTKRAEQLQLAIHDNTLKPEDRAWATTEYMKLLGRPTDTTPTVTGAKGAYGPGGAPVAAPPNAVASIPPNATAPARRFTPPTPAFTTPGAGLPDQANTSPPSFHASRYGNDPVNLGRAKANLDQQDAGDTRVNQLLYKRDIGGENFAKIYGTDDPNMMHPGMAPASAIPDIYGGKPTIPADAGVGYYDAKGGFIGPAYDPSGVKLPVPHGTAGMVGTANLGLNYDQNSGNVLHPTAAQGAAISGQPKPIQNPTSAFTQPPIAQAPATPAALVPAALPPSGPTANYNIHTGFTPEAMAFMSQYLNLPKLPSQQQQRPQPALADLNPAY